MKNATEYGKKFLKTLPELEKRLEPATHPEGLGILDSFILAVLRQDTSLADARDGLTTLKAEFIDYNELRVSPARDIVELLNPSVPDRRGKALEITSGLNLIFDHGNKLDFEHAAELGKRELRAHLRESLGFSSFVEAYMMLNVFDARAIPVDEKLLQRLKSEKLVHKEADSEDVRSMLERVISAKDAVSAYAVLSAYANEPMPEPEEPRLSKTDSKKEAKPAKKKAKSATKSSSSKKASSTDAKSKSAAKKTTTKATDKKASSSKTAAKKKASKSAGASKSKKKSTAKKSSSASAKEAK